ncbi:MAG: NAD(P)H-dependent oxidoreductase [Rhodospirillaceae bacterium]|nr:NAD(P)H-dependent oxidoreductase [Rhodospirillaceae bacterium]
MAMSLDFVVIYGSVRSDRKGIGLARFLVAQLEARGHAAHLADPLALNLPLLDRMYKEFAPGEAPPAMAEHARRLRAADGFVIVSGEYNHGIPPALKNLLDLFLEEYFWRPSAIACYSAGPFGGVRAAMQLRMTLSELGTPSIPSLLPVPQVGSAFAADGTPADPAAWDRRAGKFIGELEWYARALKAEREAGTPY